MNVEAANPTPPSDAGTPPPAADPATPADSPAPEPTPDAGNQSLLEQPEAAAPEVPQNWPDNWRELIAGEDSKTLKQLERIKSPEMMAKRLMDMQATISKGLKPLAVDEKSTPEEVEKYRKEMGIPEKAEEYALEFANDELNTDDNKEVLGMFQEFAHEKNLPPAQAKEILGWYEEAQAAQEQQLVENAYTMRQQTQEELIAEWGGEYKSNKAAIGTFLEAKLGEEAKASLIGQRFADGTFLGDNPHFLRMMSEIATDHVGPGAIFSGDVEQTYQDVETKIAENMKLLKGSRDDQAKYRSEEMQKEMADLFAKKARLDERRKGK